MSAPGPAPSPDAQAAKPRSVSAMSVPGLLTLLQNEWDAATGEVHSLKKQLEAVQQELAHALYQYDAATRVIARLLKERDAARSAVVQLQANLPTPSVPSVTEAPVAEKPSITPAVVKKMTDTQKQLSQRRKKRVVSPSLATQQALERYTCTATHPLHKTAHPGIACLDLHENQELLTTGGVDGDVIIFNRPAAKVAATLSGHTKRVNSVLFHPAEPLVLSGSADRTVRMWTANEQGTFAHERTLETVHSGAVTGLALHPCGDYAVAASKDSTWSFHDIRQGACLAQVASPEPETEATKGLESVQFHPDGLILATGTTASVVKLWDIKSQAQVAKCEGFSGPVQALSFSENGFYLATASSDNSVRLWDLRKLSKSGANFRTLTLDEGFEIRSLSFDKSGNYLMVAGTDLRIFHARSWAQIAALTDHSAPVTAARFGADAQYIASASLDRTVKLWSAPADEDAMEVAASE